ncbi:MAG: response regulator [Planctomyces sp.]|nr:response regulator [Planctomyces sp.]
MTSGHRQPSEVVDTGANDLQAESGRDGRASDPAYEFHVVGIGASAGGLESLEKLFARMPRQSGMAYIVVQHLSPDFRSVMDELLGRQTDIPIRQAEEGLEIAPDTIFLIPPKKEAILSGRRFRLRDKEPREALALPIDHFFRSLAQEAGALSIAVVLSGSGSDGSRGIRDVHQAGGLVICETEETAKFDGMPLAALETGVVDLVLRPEAVPEALAFHAARTSGSQSPQSPDDGPLVDGIDAIFKLLHAEYGIDFSYYKSTTVGRRIQRRLSMRNAADVAEYADRLRDDPAELNSLYRDLLIGVTHFFRDVEAFELLEKSVIPEIIERAGNEEVRVWVAGCATGEEAYSIAILFHECFERLGRSPSFKLFATDVHNASLEIAGAGEYGADSVVGVSEERLERYFELAGNKFVVVPELRKLIVFAPHNLLKDAPFTKLDMITCRNLLIYFQPLAQKKALSLFQFGLKTGGLLFLGPSESPGELLDEFEPVDGHWKMFRKRRDTRLPADLRFPLPHNRITLPRFDGRQTSAPAARGAIDTSLLKAYDWILARHMPPGVLVDDRHEILHVFGSANSLLRFKSGRPSTDALDLFDGGLRMAVMGAMQRARKEGVAVCYDGVQEESGAAASFRVCVEPVENPKAVRPQYLITVTRTQSPARLQTPDGTLVDAHALSRDRIDALETDLRFTQENLQATVEELETANEELQAANEELIASNEELQSTNEELHSVNEELYTVNAEYQKKIYELTELSADMENLMECTDVATVFLDRELRIRKFTPQIVPIFRLLSQDVGRCIDNFAHHLTRDRLIPDITRVLETGERLEEEIQTLQGRWMQLRVLPYRSEKIVKGVVLTLVDIDSLKRAQQSLSEALKDREGFIAVLSHELRNPVHAILSAAHLLTGACPDPSDIEHAASVIQRQSAHMARLLEDLLDVSRMTQNKLEMRMTSMDLRTAIQAAIETAQPAVAQHGQTLHVDVGESPLPVCGDEHRLSQVFVNLIINAAKYSPEGGLIHLSAERTDTQALVRITDNGHGIPEDLIDSIFKPFTQSSRVRHHHEGGMGVGLSLSKSIVERHHGQIAVSSDGEGKGSEFSVRIPLTAEPVNGVVRAQATPGRPVSKDAQNCEVRTIVVVEDQPDSREMLRKLLSLEGHDVQVARDGEEGIEMILAARPQVAIVDLGLPKINGYGVAKNVRARLGDRVRLIALTGHGSPEDVRAALDAGFDEHMVKPLDLKRLNALLTTDAAPA